MEKRTLAAFALAIAVMVIWQAFFASPPPARPARSSAPVTSGRGGDSAESAPAPASSTGTPSAEKAGNEPAVAAERVGASASEEFRIITRTQDIRFTNQGGQATWWRLLGYTDEGVPADLIPKQARDLRILPMRLEVPGDADLTSTLESALWAHEASDVAPEASPLRVAAKRVTFRWADGAGLKAEKGLEMPLEGYVGRVWFEVTRDGSPVTAILVLASGLAEVAHGDTQTYGHVRGQGVLFDGRSVSRFPAAKTTEARLFTPSGGTPVVWAGLESTYFASLLLPSETDAGGPQSPVALSLQPRGTAGEAAKSEEPLVTSGLWSDRPASGRLFVGPKDYQLLQSLGHGLEKVIDFSSYALIYLCTKWLFKLLTSINQYVGNYGWSIIILTFFVRLVFFPIMYKSAITMRQTSKRMTKVQPRVRAIQDRYRRMKKSLETQRKMNEEVMAVYKKEGINPMGNLGGCLPILLQMPIFIAFYNMLAVTIELRQAPFLLWIQDLSRRDPYYITPLLMGASWLLQQWMMGSSIPDPTQRRMMMLMPVMFTFFMMNMPSGLTIYWLTSNLLGMAQQFVTNRKADQLDAATHEREASPSRARRAEDGQAV